MRRPMIFAAQAFGSGIFAAFIGLINQGAAVVLFTAATAVFLWQHQKQKPSKQGKTACLFLCIFFLGALLLQIHIGKIDPLMAQAGKSTEVLGRVLQVQEKDSDFLKLEVKALWERQAGSVDKGCKTLVNFYGEQENPQDLVGRNIRFFGAVSLPEQRRNPKTFDYRLYLKTIGIRTVISTRALEVAEKPADRVSHKIAQIKWRFVRQLQMEAGEEKAGLINAMLFGDKSLLDDALYEDFQQNGTAHVLAVSGLHVGIIYGFFCFLWKGRQRIAFNLIVLSLLIFYGAMANFSPSVMRAVIMISLHILSKILYRRYDLLSAAAVTFLIILIFNPMQLFHVGFQLSFLAIFSLGVILPCLQKLKLGALLPILTVQIGMAPFTAYLFNYFSLGAFIANIPVVFLAGLIIPMGVILLLLSFNPGFLFSFGAVMIDKACEGMIFFNRLIYAGGKTSFQMVSPEILFLLLYYGVLFFCASEKGRILFLRKQWRQIGAFLLSGILLAGLVAFSMEDGFRKANVVFVDVGQGDCLHIRTPEGKNYLIDGGGNANYDVGKKTLKPYLLKNGVDKIDVAFVTHLHLDHYGGIASLAKEGMVDKLAVYDGNQVIEEKMRKETKLIPGDFLYLSQGQRVQLGKELFLQVLSPAKKTRQEYETLIQKEDDENAYSLVMKVLYKGTSILMTGDIDQEGEGELIRQYEGTEALKADILKVAHHGSKYSSSEEFIEAVSPKAAVFQVGKNNFGHPNEAVLEKYRQRGIMIYRNDRQGAVGVGGFMEGGPVSIKTMIN